MTFIENRFNNFTHFVLTQYNNFDNKFFKKIPLLNQGTILKPCAKAPPCLKIFIGVFLENLTP